MATLAADAHDLLRVALSLARAWTIRSIPPPTRLADRFSARRVFAAAVAIFTLASVGCGAAGSLGIFVLARVAQGMAGAMMTPVGQTVVLRHTEGKQLLTAIALLTWPGLLQPVIAPVLGGMVTTYFSWRWNFLLNIPIGAATYNCRCSISRRSDIRLSE
jgi:MFS family permease